MLDRATLSCQAHIAIAANARQNLPCCLLALNFSELLRETARRFPSQQAFAEAIGLSTARLNRAMNKADYPLNVVNCLRLARIVDESASDVLRAAGKSDVADLIESLYGRPQEVSAAKREVIDLLADVNDTSDLAAIAQVLRRFADDERREMQGARLSETQPHANQEAKHGSRAKAAGRKR